MCRIGPDTGHLMHAQTCSNNVSNTAAASSVRARKVRSMITPRHILRHEPNTDVDRIRNQHPQALREAAAMIANPRSLHTRQPHTDPPSVRLGDDTAPLRMEISRHRVSPKLRAQARAWDPQGTLLHPPTFVLTLRVAGPACTPATAKAWVRALLPDMLADTLHERDDAFTPTFEVILDGRFHPIRSPYSSSSSTTSRSSSSSSYTSSNTSSSSG